MLGEGYRLSSLATPSAPMSLDLGQRFQNEMRGPSGDGFKLDPTALTRATRTTSGLNLGPGSDRKSHV